MYIIQVKKIDTSKSNIHVLIEWLSTKLIDDSEFILQNSFSSNKYYACKLYA